MKERERESTSYSESSGPEESEAYDVRFSQNQLTDIWTADEVVDLVEYAYICIRMLTIRMLTYA